MQNAGIDLECAADVIYQRLMRGRLPLSVAIVTFNEETRLPRCLNSISDLASEVVIVDSGSTDETGSVARANGARFIVHPWEGHVAQKNIAWTSCSQPWVLALDADEVVSPELAESIRALFSHGMPQADGYSINRRTYYLGRWIKHTWHPEWRLRLARRDKARWVGLDPHDRLEVTGTTARLKGDLLHYSYRNLADHFGRTVRYAAISATTMDSAGKRCQWYHIVISPWMALIKRLVLKQGFRDGLRGWIIAYTAFFGVLAKYATLFEQQQRLSSAESALAPGSMFGDSGSDEEHRP
ncbi:MAG: glycosyltransferase family 2 protein [Verrucomicrobiae bacterium]|nr:glycosyltransferase family 2 protein [Verrucomicrobiae bacterium]